MIGRISLAVGTALFASVAGAKQEPPIAIIGATIIDGTDSAPIAAGSIVIENGKIVAVGASKDIAVPKNARKVDGRGKYVIPGLIDTNVHVSGYFQRELFALYAYGEQDPYGKYGYSLEGAQQALKYGVTTILDTYGPLMPLLAVRDQINRGEVVGPRLLVGGNIIGWDPGSETPPQTPIEIAQKNWFVQGTGADLPTMYRDDVVTAVNRYMDLGPDFIKIGTTVHDVVPPVTLSFSAEVHQAIVDAAHARKLPVIVHSGSVEGHRLAVATGVDIITHADLVNVEFRPSLVAELCKGGTFFAPFTNLTATPEAKLLVDHILGSVPESVKVRETLRQARAKVSNSNRARGSHLPAALQNAGDADKNSFVNALANQKRLIEGGCKIVVGTDSTPMGTPDFMVKGFEPAIYSDMGSGTLLAIQGLVLAGMSPKEALISATRRGAEATGLSDKVGTLQAGKIADLVILEADPLQDITNIRKIGDVMSRGVVVDRKALPTRPFIYERDQD